VRLSGPDTKHPLSKRLIHLIIRRKSGVEVPDVVKTLHHRPRFFGNAFSKWADAVMRGPSDWSQGDREVMAALVSSWNQCLF
jgi:hypothetical protein